MVFPHHENEIAQSEGATGKQFARYWLHNGSVMFSGRKMAKSVGNVVLVKDALARHPGEAVRLYFLSHHYRTPVDFGEDELAGSLLALERFYKTSNELDAAFPRARAVGETAEEKMSDLERQVWRNAKDFPERFRSAMDDDFNTAGAIGHVFELERELASLAASGVRSQAASFIVGKARAAIKDAASVLGVFGDAPEA